ncbi:MAG: hypothetical protein ACAI34_17410 [Verrucomicrobium sp.]|nr:hypothetical protein [Verrucomicrobium sp.]
MLSPDAFRPLPGKKVTSPWYGMSRSLDILSSPFDIAGKVMRGITHGVNALFTLRNRF